MISGHGADLQFKGSIVIEKNKVVYNSKKHTRQTSPLAWAERVGYEDLEDIRFSARSRHPVSRCTKLGDCVRPYVVS
jgi:hypothetical protein